MFSADEDGKLLRSKKSPTLGCIDLSGLLNDFSSHTPSPIIVQVEGCLEKKLNNLDLLGRGNESADGNYKSGISQL